MILYHPILSLDPFWIKNIRFLQIRIRLQI